MSKVLKPNILPPIQMYSYELMSNNDEKHQNDDMGHAHINFC